MSTAPRDRIDAIMARQATLEAERAPWEAVWREIDERVNPLGEGGFTPSTPGGVRGLRIFDHTASIGLERFSAAYTGMIIPRGERYHTLATSDAALNDDPQVQAWLEQATERLFAMRYAAHAGFDPQANMNIRSLGSYGCGPFWVDFDPRWGLYYKTLHMSECFVDEDARGRIDTLHRKFTLTARQAAQMFDRDRLPPRIATALGNNKLDERFQFLHVVRPRADRDPARIDYAGMEVESLYLALDDKVIVREGGYRSMPFAFSRYANAPGEKYGRSPALMVLGTIRTANEIARTMLRAGHKATDPPLLVPEDGVLSQVQTMPGGINVGGLDFNGRPMVMPMNTGGNLPVGMELLNNEREVIRDAFLEKVWSLILERKDRMTATEVLEISRLQGMLLAPMASKQEAEWLGPMIARELDIAMQHNFIDPMPPVMREAGARLKVVYDNPLSRAAKAEEALGFQRLLETLNPLAAIDPGVYDVIDIEQAPRELARSLAVKSRYLRTPDEVAALKEERAQAQAQQQIMDQMQQAAAASADLSKARGEASALV